MTLRPVLKGEEVAKATWREGSFTWDMVPAPEDGFAYDGVRHADFAGFISEATVKNALAQLQRLKVSMARASTQGDRR